MENLENNNTINWLEEVDLDEPIEWAYNYACEDYQPGDYEDDEDNIPNDLPEDPDYYYSELEDFLTYDTWYIRNLLECMGLLGHANSKEDLNQIDEFFHQVEEYDENLALFASHCLKNYHFNYHEWEDKYREKMYRMIDDSCRY